MRAVRSSPPGVRMTRALSGMSRDRSDTGGILPDRPACRADADRSGQAISWFSLSPYGVSIWEMAMPVW